MDEIADNSITLTSNLSCTIVPTGLRYYYISPEDADAYFQTSISGVTGNTVWEESSREQKSRALAAATKLIDQLKFSGNKPEGQKYEFPRQDQGTEIPLDIQFACAEIAKQLNEGVNIEQQIRNLFISSHTIGTVKTVYQDNKVIPDYLRAGIPSIVAWNYLKPYLANWKMIKLYKV